MGVLVDELLLLAQLDAGGPLACEPVNLTRLAIDAASDARAAPPITGGGSSSRTSLSWSAATSAGCARCWPT